MGKICHYSLSRTRCGNLNIAYFFLDDDLEEDRDDDDLEEELLEERLELLEYEREDREDFE